MRSVEERRRAHNDFVFRKFIAPLKEYFPDNEELQKVITEIENFMRNSREDIWSKNRKLDSDIMLWEIPSQVCQKYDRSFPGYSPSDIFIRRYYRSRIVEVVLNLLDERNTVSSRRFKEKLKKLRDLSVNLRKSLEMELANNKKIFDNFTCHLKSYLDPNSNLMKAIENVEGIMKYSNRSLFFKELNGGDLQDYVKTSSILYASLDDDTKAIIEGNMPEGGLYLYDYLEKLKSFCYFVEDKVKSPLKDALSELRKEISKRQDRLRTAGKTNQQVSSSKVEAEEPSSEYHIQRITDENLQFILQGTSIKNLEQSAEGWLGHLFGKRTRIPKLEDLRQTYKQQFATFLRLKRSCESVTRKLLQAKRQQLLDKQNIDNLRLSMITDPSPDSSEMMTLEDRLEISNNQVERFYKDYIKVIQEIESLGIESELRDLNMELRKNGSSIFEIDDLVSDVYTQQGAAMSGGGSGGGYTPELDSSCLPIAYAIAEPTAPVFDNSEGHFEDLTYDPSLPTAPEVDIVIEAEGEYVAFSEVQAFPEDRGQRRNPNTPVVPEVEGRREVKRNAPKPS